MDLMIYYSIKLVCSLFYLKVQVVFQHYVISNLDKYFEKSNEFMPERWLKTCPHGMNESSKGHHPFASLPFGFGRRMCLGKRFADIEIQTVIVKVSIFTFFFVFIKTIIKIENFCVDSTTI